MINFSERLKKMKNRRQGTAEINRLLEGLESFGVDIRGIEDYETLDENEAIRYVIGAMAPVSPESTQTSISEGERVADTLIGLLQTVGIDTERRMQGSVALDIHIEGHSDVDMLIIKHGLVTYHSPALNETAYTPSSDTRTMEEIVQEIRLESENKLSSRYHAANVDCTGNKSISISGGSLKRKVDIVPSSWLDTHEYQSTKKEYHRVIRIYDKKAHALLENKPFLHIKNVNDKDTINSGNLKKVVRLMKNIIADMPDYKKSKAKKLSSYDLTGIAYSMDRELVCPNYLPLLLLENLRSYLAQLQSSFTLRDSLYVPDETRKIFNDDSKIEALNILSNEVNELAISVVKSLQPHSSIYSVNVLKNKPIYI